jgi:hypothetical protein
MTEEDIRRDERKKMVRNLTAGIEHDLTVWVRADICFTGDNMAIDNIDPIPYGEEIFRDPATAKGGFYPRDRPEVTEHDPPIVKLMGGVVRRKWWQFWRPEVSFWMATQEYDRSIDFKGRSLKEVFQEARSILSTKY